MSNSPLDELQRICASTRATGSKLKAAKFYRDKLGWAVHPLCGPHSNAPKTERGKKPLCKGWRRWQKEDATDEVLHKYLGPQSGANLGVVVRRPSICVDLDSKADRGESVRKWLKKHPKLAKIPREKTGGGVHLHFTCSDLPSIQKRGKPHDKALFCQLTDKVTAELFFDGLNLVVSPSVHATGPTYEWEVAGKIPEVTWAQLQKWFGFELPEKQGADGAADKPSEKDDWWLRYEGDFKTLDLAKLFQKFGLLGEPGSADKGTTSVKCPWHGEHSGTEPWKPNDTSTTIFANTIEAHWPGFSCLHSHCTERKLEQVLAWFHAKEPGCVDAHCTRKRIWEPGQTADDGRPRLLLPGPGRPNSVFASEAATMITPKKCWFLKSDQVMKLHNHKVSEKLEYLGFASLKPAEVCTAIEQHVEVGCLREREKEKVFVETSMTEQTAKLLINAVQFKEKLPPIVRILDVQIPILYQNEIVLPEKGYDSRFGSYCDTNAPSIRQMSVEEARSWIHKALEGFCWSGRQDLVHAIARFITPFCRGLMGWDARFPLWVFEANRERAGKDYLAGVPMLTYEGHLCEDAPIGDEEELRKRVTTALVHGRRMMHFANCRGHIGSQAFEQAVTGKVWGDRILGGNTEAKVPNEIEFSLSANTGLSYTTDLAARMRRIGLAYPHENPNSRKFPIPDLHGWVLEHRSELLSAAAALVKYWQEKGCPPGLTPFTSFPEWARVVGGVTSVCGLGDPCLPTDDTKDVSGDRLTNAMKDLFQLCHTAHDEAWMEKTDIYTVVRQNQEIVETLEHFGDLADEGKDGRSAKTKLGLWLRQYVDRVLGGLQLRTDSTSSRTERAKYWLIPENGASDRGGIVLGNVFGPGNSRPSQGSNGDVGDLGDLQPPQNIEEEVSKDKKSAEPETYTKREGTPEGHQRHQGHHLVASGTDLAGISEAIKRSGAPVALDIETYGKARSDALNPWKGEIRLLSLAIPDERPWIIDLKQIGYDLGPLKATLDESQVIGHNLKFDALWLRVKCNLVLQKVFCSMTASRLLTNGSDLKNDLGECLRRHLGVNLPKDQATSDWSNNALSAEQLRYATDDVLHLHALKAALDTEIDKSGLRQVLGLELQLLPIVVGIEAKGIAVNRDGLSRIKADEERRAGEVQEQIRQELQQPMFNPASPAQVAVALQARGLSITDTKEETLLDCDDMVARQVLAFRSARKRAEQAETLLEAATVDGRIHASFNPMGAQTGRFSSSDPNLQNVARGPLRNCFEAPPGHKLVVADYSQIELRIAAAIAGEPQMLEAYRKDEDLHTKTASLVTGQPLDQISKDGRQLAKAVNFGLLYGQSAKGLVRYAKNSYGVELSASRAEEIHRLFFRGYKSLAIWHRNAWGHSRNGCKDVRTVLGRRRLLPCGADKAWQRFTGLVNTPVQGASADALKLAMVELAAKLPPGAHIVSTVHDEIIVEVLEEQAQQAAQTVQGCMVGAMRRLFPDLPVEAEVKVVSSWGEK